MRSTRVPLSSCVRKTQFFLLFCCEISKMRYRTLKKYIGLYRLYSFSRNYFKILLEDGMFKQKAEDTFGPSVCPAWFLRPISRKKLWARLVNTAKIKLKLKLLKSPFLAKLTSTVFCSSNMQRLQSLTTPQEREKSIRSGNQPLVMSHKLSNNARVHISEAPFKTYGRF